MIYIYTNFSKIAKLLTNLLKKDETFVWNEAQDKAFKELRDLLRSEPLLQYPDFAKPFIVTMDASGYAIGGILSQGTTGKVLCVPLHTPLRTLPGHLIKPNRIIPP